MSESDATCFLILGDVVFIIGMLDLIVFIVTQDYTHLIFGVIAIFIGLIPVFFTVLLISSIIDDIREENQKISNSK